MTALAIDFAGFAAVSFTPTRICRQLISEYSTAWFRKPKKHCYT